MVLGLRRAWESGGWQNPYITDGLVAMWDGEWNAGGGGHVASSSKWVDVVNRITVSSSEVQSFDQSTGEVSGQFSADTPSVIESALTATEWSLDVLTGSSVYSGAYADATCGATVTTDSGVFGLSFLYGFNRARSGMGAGTYLYSRSNLPTRPLAVTLYKSEGSLNMYINGDAAHAGNSNSTAPIGTLGKLLIGGYSPLRRVGIYSRALTADEVAHNYAVDAARFNLA